MKVTVSTDQGVTKVTLDGPMTDRIEAALTKSLSRIKAVHVEFDCERISAVNSFGVKAFTAFLDKLRSKHTFEYQRCPRILVDYFYLLPRALNADAVSSLAVPFRCEGCQAESEPVIAIEDARSKRRPELRCRACGGRRYPSVDLEDYVDFRSEQVEGPEG